MELIMGFGLWILLGVSGFLEIQSVIHRIRMSQAMDYLWEEDLRRVLSHRPAPDNKPEESLKSTIKQMRQELHLRVKATSSMIVLLEEAGMRPLLYQGREACHLIILSGPVALFWYIRYKETCFRHGIRE